MKIFKLIKLSFLIFCILGLLYYLYIIFMGGNSVQYTSSKNQLIKRDDIIQKVTFAGNVSPERETIVTAPFHGYIKKLFVKIGQKVKADDPLVSVVQSLQSIDPVYPLRAPFEGIVVDIKKQEGEFAKQEDSSDFILKINSLNSMYINAFIPEMDVIKIKKGLEAVIKYPAISEKQYKGVIEDVSISSRSQDTGYYGATKVEYFAKIRILDIDDSIRPGMSSVIDIVTLKKEKILVIPHECILKEDENYYVVLSNGKKQKIKLGIQNETHYEIIEGVNEGDEVKQVDFYELIESEN